MKFASCLKRLKPLFSIPCAGFPLPAPSPPSILGNIPADDSNHQWLAAIEQVKSLMCPLQQFYEGYKTHSHGDDANKGWLIHPAGWNAVLLTRKGNAGTSRAEKQAGRAVCRGRGCHIPSLLSPSRNHLWLLRGTAQTQTHLPRGHPGPLENQTQSQISDTRLLCVNGVIQQEAGFSH